MKIGIIVDGPGDLASLKARFGHQFKVLKTDGPRGHCAPINQIVSKSQKQVSMLKAFSCEKVIILIDFECRSQPYSDFCDQIKRELLKRPWSSGVVFVVANQMIENWYLADLEKLSSSKNFIKDKIKQKPFEGKHGKNEIKRFIKKGYSYSETKHGPQLFQIIRDEVAVKNSFSFSQFLAEI